MPYRVLTNHLHKRKEKMKTNSTTESEEETDTKEYATLPEVTETENNETTDYFQNVSVYEETTKKSKKSKKKNARTRIF